MLTVQDDDDFNTEKLNKVLSDVGLADALVATSSKLVMSKSESIIDDVILVEEKRLADITAKNKWFIHGNREGAEVEPTQHDPENEYRRETAGNDDNTVGELDLFM